MDPATQPVPQPGALLAHYRIERRLGAGGMGEVYLATDSRLGRPVALKVLSPALASDPAHAQRFTQEARLASILSHPNVAHIYEIGEASGFHFIAMEYVDGRPLSSLLADGPLPPASVIEIGLQIAGALEEAHSKNIVHRDIKPANILIDARGAAKVLDFGLAKIETHPGARAARDEETLLLTTAGLVLGTVHYMSPEQALGLDIDHRTDLFSLGTVLYEMASARLPFEGANSQQILARILNAAPAPLARLRHEIPEALDRIVVKCLEKDPSRRYQSARDLIVDLRNLQRDLSPSPAALTSALPTAAPLRAVLVDDEDLARSLLREYCSATAGITVAAECANGFEAVKAIAELKPDLVFLDVQMPKLDGFEVLELIGPDVPVIFATAFDEYAMRAFDAHAVDYLLKPFSLDRFQTAVERARARAGRPAPLPPPAQLAAEARPPRQFLERIVVKDGPRVHIIPVSRLEYAEAQDDYVSLHSAGKNYLKQQTISSLEASLDPDRFVRIHRSHIVNIETVARIEPYARDSRVAILTTGARLPVSRAGYEQLKALLEAR